MAPIAVLLMVGLGSACWRSYGEDGIPDGGGTDAGRGDAGRPTPDAATTRRDGAMPLPPEPEPDLGPDARPSDYPEASGWTDPDPSTFSHDDPCCRPEGPPRAIRMGDVGGIGVADLEWNGVEWGLLYTDRERTVFARLDEMGAPVGSRVDLGLVHNIRAALAWAGGRYGVAVATGAGDLLPRLTATVGLVDARGVPAAGWTTFAPARAVAMARLTYRNRWAVAWTGEREELLIREMDAAASFVGEPRHLAWHVYENEQGLVGLKSRVVAVWASADGVSARALSIPLASDSGPEIPVFDPGISGGLAATAFRDLAVVADVTERGAMRMAALDPWEGDVVLRLPVALETPPGVAGRVGLGASAADGLLAACLPTAVLNDAGMPETSEVLLRLLGPDLGRLGAPVRVTTLDDPDVGCAVGFSPRGLLVAWWYRPEPVVWVQLYRVG